MLLVAVAAILLVGLIGLAFVTRNAFAYPAGCFHPIRTNGLEAWGCGPPNPPRS